MAIKAKPHHCEEATTGMPGYVPCNKPATHTITFPSGETALHCEMCTDHAVRNRGGKSEPYEIPEQAGTSDADIAQYAEDAQAKVGGDNILARITQSVRDVHELDEEIADAEAALRILVTQRKTLIEDTIPNLMSEAGQDDIKTVDGVRVTIKETLRASIPKAKTAEALAWLIKHGQSAIIKREFGLKFGRDEADKADEALNAIVAAGFMPSDKQSVHSGTLSSTLKELIAEGEDVPLPLFGGFVQTAAVLKTAK